MRFIILILSFIVNGVYGAASEYFDEQLAERRRVQAARFQEQKAPRSVKQSTPESLLDEVEKWLKCRGVTLTYSGMSQDVWVNHLLPYFTRDTFFKEDSGVNALIKAIEQTKRVMVYSQKAQAEAQGITNISEILKLPVPYIYATPLVALKAICMQRPGTRSMFGTWGNEIGFSLPDTVDVKYAGRLTNALSLFSPSLRISNPTIIYRVNNLISQGFNGLPMVLQNITVIDHCVLQPYGGAEDEQSKIGPEGGKELAKVLPSLPRLDTLYLGNNRLGDEGTIAIINALPSTLGALDLSKNEMSVEGGLTALATALSRLSLEYLYIGKNSLGNAGMIVFAGALRSNTTLKKLEWDNDRGLTDIAPLISVLAKNKNVLTHLVLLKSPVDIGGPRVQEFKQAWAPRPLRDDDELGCNMVIF